MRIAAYLADQNPHRDRSLGITRYSDTLLGALRSEQVGLTQVTSRSSFSSCHAEQTLQLPVRTDGPVGRMLVDQLHCGLRSVRDLDVQGFLYPKGFLPLLLPPGRQPVAIVHDVILQHYADHHRGYIRCDNLAYFMLALARTLGHAGAIATHSRTSRLQIEAFCHRRGLRMPRVEVVPAASDYERALDEAPVAREKANYVVHLASPAPHKRTHHLLERWQLLQARGRDLPELLLVGKVPDASLPLVAQLAGVRRVPPLPRDTFVDTLRRARALLMPSEIEGFGLPVLEAYYVGTPGCYARGTAIDEYMSPVSSVGAFALDDLDDFEAALGRVLDLSPEQVLRAATELRARYGIAQLGRTMHRLLASHLD